MAQARTGLEWLALGEYFFFSRDRLSPAAPGARLSAPLQALLSKLQSPVAAQRRTAVTARLRCRRRSTRRSTSALLDRAIRRPESDAMRSVLELTARVPRQLADADGGLGQHTSARISAGASTRVADGRQEPAGGSRANRAVGCVRNTSLQKAIARGQKDAG